ncbi:achaete-scute homolog 1-like [Argiope bruennichi]|uniref:Achaete-scute like protein n=1 Tax=Argiope bruennichi TaxID=94029 RepID=A0A8T0EDZ9_ARGBR|nr:achaete-scute homolog 1-like [Argiope bruennichi]KAF8770873.1 Achaete-scute like protein [Argiope bruennichi]
MTSLTLLGGPLDPSHMSMGSTPTTTYLLTTTSQTTTTASTTNSSQRTTTATAKIAPKRLQSTSKRRSHAAAAPAVARRNERERNRVRQVNLGFATLRQHVPNGAKSKKMSKVETLRSAVQYIKQLQRLLNDEEGTLDDENSAPSSYEEQFHGAYGEGLLQLGGSPDPSLGSDASSPYDSLSPEDEELLDFTTWLS